MIQLYSNNNVILARYLMATRIQNIYYNLLIQSLTKHCKVFVLRIDVALPPEIVLSTISDFTHRYIEIERRAGNDPLYLTVREISLEGRIHHHLLLFFNGNRTRCSYQHFLNARTILANITSHYGYGPGHIDECNRGHRNGIMIERNTRSYDDLFEVLRQSSYLAKTESKETTPGKSFFYSKVPIVQLTDEDITRNFQALFPNLIFGIGSQWYSVFR